MQSQPQKAYVWWGRTYWDTIHITTLSYPDDPTIQELDAAASSISALRYTLPCYTCKQHTNNILDEMDFEGNKHVYLQSKTSFIDWGIDFHNEVNKQLGKPILSHDEGLKQVMMIPTRLIEARKAQVFQNGVITNTANTNTANTNTCNTCTRSSSSKSSCPKVYSQLWGVLLAFLVVLFIVVLVIIVYLVIRNKQVRNRSVVDHDT
ncbi:Erv1/Alr family protein [uncultured virus]|nr:Erv1/Alr family protein [uncultured virus]